MANLSFGITGPDTDLTVSMEVMDTDTPRILAYLASTTYGMVVVSEVGQPPTRPATLEEMVRAYAAGILKTLLEQTVNYERYEASRLAAEQVTNIVPIEYI